MPEAHVFAPGHLTGLFQICIDLDDPLNTGARGSGVSLSEGVHTRVKAEPARKPSHTININGDEMIDAYVSENVLSKYRSMIHDPYEIIIDHTIETPITAGFGSSGGLPGDRVRRVFSDDPNELWSGYIGQGAALLDP